MWDSGDCPKSLRFRLFGIKKPYQHMINGVFHMVIAQTKFKEKIGKVPLNGEKPKRQRQSKKAQTTLTEPVKTKKEPKKPLISKYVYGSVSKGLIRHLGFTLAFKGHRYGSILKVMSKKELKPVLRTSEPVPVLRTSEPVPVLRTSEPVLVSKKNNVVKIRPNQPYRNEAIKKASERPHFTNLRAVLSEYSGLDDKELVHRLDSNKNIVKELKEKNIIYNAKLGKVLKPEERDFIKKFYEENVSRYRNRVKEGSMSQKKMEELVSRLTAPNFLEREKGYQLKSVSHVSMSPKKLYEFAKEFNMSRDKVQRLTQQFSIAENPNNSGYRIIEAQKEINSIVNCSDFHKVYGHSIDVKEYLELIEKQQSQEKLDVNNLRIKEYQYRSAVLRYIQSVRSNGKTRENFAKFAKELGTSVITLKKILMKNN